MPFFIRGPNVPQNLTVNCPTSNTDVVPTLFKLAGIPLHANFDGTPMPIHEHSGRRGLGSRGEPLEHINIEFWGGNYGEGVYPQPGKFRRTFLFIIKTHECGSSYAAITDLLLVTLQNNTYKALRIVSPSFDLLYTVWCTNEKELYEIRTDPGQMHNLHGSSGQLSNFDIAKLETRLDALLLVLKSYKGKQCIKPWATMHPQGDVQSLKDALNEKFDHFYNRQPKVAFTSCAEGFLRELEGPQDAVPFSG